MIAKEQTARKLVAKQTTDMLIASFVATDHLIHDSQISPPDRVAVATSRGWIMDELDKRDELALLDPTLA